MAGLGCSHCRLTSDNVLHRECCASCGTNDTSWAHLMHNDVTGIFRKKINSIIRYLPHLHDAVNDAIYRLTPIPSLDQRAIMTDLH